jgi:adenine-specific DNA-methyltransferase
MSTKKQPEAKTVDTIKHDEATRKNIPTAEYQSMVEEEQQAYLRVPFERRNKDLDPQLVWRGKDITDWSDLMVQAPPLYIQEKVHPKALIDDLMRHSKEGDFASGKIMADLFSDFNGLPHDVDKTEFYQHDQHWSNRMILGDSLQVMASLAEREGLRGKVQCIYFDPPYGIKFNSNFQWSTTSRDVKDGNSEHITREPEQVKAFRDTWRDGIHSYLTYLRDRLTVARDLLTDSGSIFVQIGDENVHRVRSVMDEVFGEENFVGEIIISKTAGASMEYLDLTTDFILYYSKNYASLKYKNLFTDKLDAGSTARYYVNVQLPDGSRRQMNDDEKLDLEKLDKTFHVFSVDAVTSQTSASTTRYEAAFHGKKYESGIRQWATPLSGLNRLIKANRITLRGNSIGYVRFLQDYPVRTISNLWSDISGSIQSRTDPKVYVVQSSTTLIQRCLLMATDPGDLVLDPTCGSGTTATVAEQWGRRWITIDTSRVALALARARIMGARYPYYLLLDSKEGQLKEAEISRTPPSMLPTYGNIKRGFVYDRVPHITLKSIANNTEIDVIWDKWQNTMEPLRHQLNAVLRQKWEEWEIPSEASDKWHADARDIHSKWWKSRIARQKEIDASIASKGEYEYLYDKPYEDKKKVRVAGPFTVESLSPHRILGMDEDDELIDANKQQPDEDYKGFAEMILENLKMAGVQQAHKEDRINFTSLAPWPGSLICADGRYMEGNKEKRAAIFIGPEFGTVQRIDLVEAAREAADANFDVLISCAFSYEAHATEFNKLGRLPVLKARMNADLYMADDLKNTGKGNLFVIFGEPDIEILPAKDRKVQIKINGVDVFHPSTGEVRSDSTDGIACWFIDTDYNEESFFVRHAYFLGANDSYGSLQTSLKAEINKEAWESLHSDTSRPFPKPQSGRIAVKVINHLGDEVMKVFKIQ